MPWIEHDEQVVLILLSTSSWYMLAFIVEQIFKLIIVGKQLDPLEDYYLALGSWPPYGFLSHGIYKTDEKGQYFGCNSGKPTSNGLERGKRYLSQ